MLKIAFFATVMAFGWYMFAEVFDKKLLPVPQALASSGSQNELADPPKLTGERIALLRQIAASVNTDSITRRDNDDQLATLSTATAIESEQTQQEQSVQRVVAENSSSAESLGEAPVWVLDQNSQHYTIQLALSVNRAFLTRFSNKLPDDLVNAVYPEVLKSDGEIQYTLSAGSFTSRALAEHALSRLSADTRRYGAFVRKFDNINRELIESHHQ